MDGTNSQKHESSRLLALERENNILKQDYNKLKNERELAREENKILNEENSQLKQELKKLKSENKAWSRNNFNYSTDNFVAKESSDVSDNKLRQSYDHLKQEYEHAQKLFLKEERILKVKNEEIKKLTTKLFASQKIIEQYKKNESELHSIADGLTKEVKDRDERIKAIKKYLGNSTKNRSSSQEGAKGNEKQEIKKILNSMNDYQETYCNQMSFFESKVAEIEYGLEMCQGIEEKDGRNNDDGILKGIKDLEADIEFHNGQVNRYMSEMNSEIKNKSGDLLNHMKDQLEKVLDLTRKKEVENKAYRDMVKWQREVMSSKLNGMNNDIMSGISLNIAKLEEVRARIKEENLKEKEITKVKVEEFRKEIYKTQSQLEVVYKKVEEMNNQSLSEYRKQSEELKQKALEMSHSLERAMKNKISRINGIETMNLSELSEYSEMKKAHVEFKQQIIIKGLELTEHALNYCKFGNKEVDSHIDEQRASLECIKNKIESMREYINGSGILSIENNEERLEDVLNVNDKLKRAFSQVTENTFNYQKGAENEKIKEIERLQKINQFVKEIKDMEINLDSEINKLHLIQSDVTNIPTLLLNFNEFSISTLEWQYPKSWKLTEERKSYIQQPHAEKKKDS